MRALLFDLDETLIEEEEPVVAALRATAEEAQARYGLDADGLAETVRVRARELWRSGPLYGGTSTRRRFPARRPGHVESNPRPG